MGAERDACLLLALGDELFGLELSSVAAVVPWSATSPVPFQQPDKFGSILYRGRFVGVVDLASMLGLEPFSPGEKSVIAICERDGALMGLAAPATRGIVRNLDTLAEVAVLGRHMGALVGRALKFEGETINLIDAEKFAAAVMERLEKSR